MKRAIRRIATAYKSDPCPWVVAYSGGKDSTAVLKLLYAGLSSVERYHKAVTILYCDTGVEIPLISGLAAATLRGFSRECRNVGMPVRSVVVRPKLEERFFVKVLGKGYPPPTDKFRWCTDRLAISPVSAFLTRSGYRESTIVLGVRMAESSTRSLTVKENGHGKKFWAKQRGVAHRRLFLPILDFSVRDVWAANLELAEPRILRTRELADLYAKASDSPGTRRANGAPSGAARFGCWTCTVSKHGTTLRNLIASGKRELTPLLHFRLWLEDERKKPRNRWRRRRNGDVGPGPMTKQWRRRALDRLLLAQQESGFDLIPQDEIRKIRAIWRTE